MPWPIFPECPSFGFTKLADYSVTIIERDSGIRTVNRNWYYPLHTFSAVALNDRPDNDIYNVIRFWHAVGGQSGRFLMKDYTDFKSNHNPRNNVTALDQPLVESVASAGIYEFVKVYRDDDLLYEQQRLIQKPKQGTILIAEDGVTLNPSAYTIDYDEGTVEFDSSVSGVLTWGGEFYVPVMFESTPEFMISNRRVQSTGFALRELRL